MTDIPSYLGEPWQWRRRVAHQSVSKNDCFFYLNRLISCAGSSIQNSMSCHLDVQLSQGSPFSCLCTILRHTAYHILRTVSLTWPQCSPQQYSLADPSRRSKSSIAASFVFNFSGRYLTASTLWKQFMFKGWIVGKSKCVASSRSFARRPCHF